MADKTVGELPRASTVTTTDLFVLEQAGQAKSLTGKVLMDDLAAALDAHGGIKSIALNDDYTLTFTLSDDTEVTTTSVRGEKGAKGDKGTDGRAITGIEKTDTSGLVDTYKISFSDNTSVNFTVTNGSSIQSIAKTGTSGLTDTYTVTLADGSTSTFTVTNGNGIASITLESGTHSPGTTDTYKILFQNGEYTTFSVYNGMNGSGAVSTVNTKSPDVSGDVNLTGDDIPVSADDETTIPNAIAKKQAATKDLTAEATLADGDYFPFYDVSVTENRKTPWSNIVAKIRSALFGTLNGFLKANGSGTLSAVATVPVANGGTGATTAAAARTNLNALSSADGAIVTANLGDGIVTREKLAADALGIAIESRSDTTPFAAECNGKICVVAPSVSRNFTLTSEVLAALPIGWAVTLIRGEVVGGVTYTVGWEADIPAIDGNDRKMLWSGAGSISLDRPGDMVTITKWYNLPRIIVMGNTNVRNIYVGTSDSPPSSWASGDIYLKYE